MVCFIALLFAIHAVATDPYVRDTGERPPTPEEASLTQLIRQDALRHIMRSAQHDGLAKRDAHMNPHGCLRAEFRVLEDISPALRQGVFAEPGRRYPAWVRFSNGTQADDREPDGRGMAIKLMGVPGDKLLPDELQEGTQDFVMLNHPTFLLRNVTEYRDFFEKQVQGDDFGYFIGYNPANWHLRELRIGLQMLLQKVPSPLAIAYFSMVPFKHGDALNVKYSVLPCDLEKPGTCRVPERQMPEQPSAHYLREALVNDLQPRATAQADEWGARFVFRVQLQKPGNMPIEDASIEWSEAQSPYVPVAELWIRRQRFNSEAQNALCEALSFTPWHALPAHRPIGGLNRARKVMYEAISKQRHATNGTHRAEPRDFDLGVGGEPTGAQPGAEP